MISERHLEEHGNDPFEEFLGVSRALLVDEVEKAANIKDRPGLQGRSSSNGVEALGIMFGCAPDTFCDVERDGHGRTLELVPNRGMSTGEVIDRSEDNCQEFDSSLVHI